jgi:hypothetical protein
VDTTLVNVGPRQKLVAVGVIVVKTVTVRVVLKPVPLQAMRAVT